MIGVGDYALILHSLRCPSVGRAHQMQNSTHDAPLKSSELGVVFQQFPLFRSTHQISIFGAEEQMRQRALTSELFVTAGCCQSRFLMTAHIVRE